VEFYFILFGDFSKMWPSSRFGLAMAALNYINLKKKMIRSSEDLMNNWEYYLIILATILIFKQTPHSGRFFTKSGIDFYSF
jgi:hypothetical protein